MCLIYFREFTATGCYQFRVTRLLTLTEDVEDLAEALKDELSSRRFGLAVRLEVNKNCPTHIYEYLLKEFDLDTHQLYRVDGPVNLAHWSRILNAHIYAMSHISVIPKILKNLQIFSVRCRNKIFYCIILLNHFPRNLIIT